MCVLGMMVLCEILWCLEFDKHQNREKTENPQTMGVREEPSEAPVQAGCGQMPFFPHTEPLPSGTVGCWLGWFGRFKAKVGLPTANHLAALGLLGSLGRGVGEANGAVGFQTISRCLGGPTYFLCKVQSVCN